jgi:hypothetical protein
MSGRLAQAALVAGMLILVGIGWMVATTLLARPTTGPAFTVRIPPIGAAAPIRLDDGRPAFIVHHQAGGISVLDAFSSFVPYGVFKVVAWCPEARVFEDRAYGARYDEWGAHVWGPAPSGLIVFSWQMGAGGFVRIVAPLGPASGPADATNPPPVDLAACTWTGHDFDGDQQLTPAQAAAQPDGSWVVVAGVLDPLAHRLCGLAVGCVDPATIDGLVFEPHVTQREVDYLTDPRLRRWLARVTDGRLAHLTMIPDLDTT